MELLDESELGKIDVRYATFGARFLAFLIDAIIFLFLFGSFRGILGAIQGPLHDWPTFVVGFPYYVLLESGPWQGTVGKKVMGIKVVDAITLERISVAKAIGRYFARILSAIIFLIGYLMALFSEKTQTLHDKLCNTYVVKG